MGEQHSRYEATWLEKNNVGGKEEMGCTRLGTGSVPRNLDQKTLLGRKGGRTGSHREGSGPSDQSDGPSLALSIGSYTVSPITRR